MPPGASKEKGISDKADEKHPESESMVLKIISYNYRKNIKDLDFSFTDGSTIDGRWAIEDGILKVRARGGMESFYLGKDKLIATDGGQEYLKVEKLANIEKAE